MIAVNCPGCQRVTGHKRALGWGTFFAVVLTGGVWLLALPFYQSRCVVCGLAEELPPLPRAPARPQRTDAPPVAPDDAPLPPDAIRFGPTPPWEKR
jgi:hypothetical protein